MHFLICVCKNLNDIHFETEGVCINTKTRITEEKTRKGKNIM